MYIDERVFLLLDNFKMVAIPCKFIIYLKVKNLSG